MAKRKYKKRQQEEKTSSGIGNILFGVILIALSTIGLFESGFFGELVKKAAIFMFGAWYFLFLILTIGLGIYILFHKDKPNCFTSRLIGIYLLIIGILMIAHTQVVLSNETVTKDIIATTMNNIKDAWKNMSELTNAGGGIIGGILTYLSMLAFGKVGTFICIGIFGIVGLSLIFDLNPADIYERIKERRNSVLEDEESDNDEETAITAIKDIKGEEVKADDHGFSNKKVVITSLDDLNKDATQNVRTETDVTEEDDDTPGVYVKPPVTLLEPNKNKNVKANTNEQIAANISKLEQVFLDFEMHGKVVEVHAGPAVTQYEMEISKGTRVNKVLGISREIALAMAAKEVRIEAPIPGKNTIGVEIPNQNILAVSMREIMESKEISGNTSDKLLAPLGRDIMGNVKSLKINKTPHMLVAGATGSGKSVCINNIIVALLMRTTPEEVKMVLVDPKKVEFNVYEGIPHLLTPVVTDPKKASAALQKIVVEMDDRYETFKNSGNKKIEEYNEWVEKELKKKPDCGLKKMPYIVVIIDELADLMLVAAKEVEESIMRITQLARAAGIHLIVATQRPSADVITGVVKANIPTRISFAVSSSIDSRTILDMTGAEKLLGRGDMLYKPMDDNNPTRIQGSFVSDDEIKRVVDFVKKRSTGPKYSDKFQNLENASSGTSNQGESSSGGNNEVKDVLYDEILEYAIRMGQISASLIQRKYSIGYNRAARIMDSFEERGIVGPAKGSKPRDVLIKLEEPTEEVTEE